MNQARIEYQIWEIQKAKIQKLARNLRHLNNRRE